MKTLNIKSVARAKRQSDVLLVCLQHNTRKGNAGHRHRKPIDPAPASLNTFHRGSADPDVCAEIAASIFDELGIVLDSDTLRTDAIIGIEYVFQPPPGWDVLRFYEECLAWVDVRSRYVISAIVHRDQARPHMHVLVLAVKDGKLAGSSLSSQANRLEAQRSDFMAYMRSTLGLRPDRRAKAAAGSPLTALALSSGKGPKARAAAAKSDAALERRARASTVNLIAHEPHSPPVETTDLIAPTSYCAALSVASRLFAEGVSAGYFPRTPLRLATPAPRPPTPQSTEARPGPRMRTLIIPPGFEAFVRTELPDQHSDPSSAQHRAPSWSNSHVLQ